MASISSIIPSSATSLLPTVPGMANSAINFGRVGANNGIANGVAAGQMGQSVGAIQNSIATQEQYMEQITELTNELALKNAQCNIEKKLGEAAKSLTQ